MSIQSPEPGLAQMTAADRQRLPGMLPVEIAIFNAWWKDNAALYTASDFNVRVGRGYDPGPTVSQDQRDNAIKNSQRRIDALLWHGNEPTIVEVKFRATPIVLGQLLGYRALWLRDNPTASIPSTMLLYHFTDDDTVFLMRYFNIVAVQVDADFSGVTLNKQS